MNEKDSIKRIVDQALSEDLGSEGDITSNSLFDDKEAVEAIIKSKENGILSGVYLIQPIFKAVDNRITVAIRAKEGVSLKKGMEICRIKGPTRSILAGERTALNFLQRLSGIATATSRLVSRIQGTHAKLLDTRKTTPLLRLLEKKAVVAGGGHNHRFGLFDMILIKDTHVKAAGGPAKAVKKANAFRQTHPHLKIEVEVQSREEFFDAATAAPDRIMLDNMSLKDMRECVVYNKKLKSNIELEASGNVTQDNIRAIANTGVDFISAGSITHSAGALDIHLVII